MKKITFLAVLVLLAGFSSLPFAAEQKNESPSAVTTSDPTIPTDELALLLDPLSKDELLIEAEGWRMIVKAKAEAIARAEIAVRRENRAIERTEEIRENAEKVTEDAQRATDTVKQKVAETLEGVKSDTEGAADLDQALQKIEQVADIEEKKKLDLLQAVTMLREERTLLVDNMRAVIDKLQAKTDAGDADTQAKIKDYRLYLSGVSGINVDVTDTTSAWVSLSGWVTSHEGGLRWFRNIGSFVAILVLAWFLSDFVGRLMSKGMGRLSSPALLTDFLIKSARWVVMIIGIIWALSALEVSVAPLLAMVGAAGFIIAFAMQDSLSNFASGLMILFFRPFDIGDLVDAGGVSGKVSSMNLVSTTIRTVDNKVMVVPNSKIWGDVITNVTGVTQRRVDMEFGIGYDDDIEQAQQILEQIVADDPRIFEDPAPVIRMSALADSSVNFICRPWARPDDYWDVYWDVTREVKKRFDAEGIGIPFPQRDVHLYIKDGADKGVFSTNERKPEKAKPSGEPQPVEAMDDEQQI
jgi:small conductance mechanosensitive channel